MGSYRWYTTIISLFLVCYLVKLASPNENHREMIEYVKKQLMKSMIAQRLLPTTSNELVNSNKIGAGFNPLTGSLVCYTADCQMNGFGLSVLKLAYGSSSAGSCSDKLIPDNVHVNCLTSTSTTVDSSTIDTVKEYHDSISNRVQFSGSSKVKGAEFSYKHSMETPRVIDKLVKNHETLIMTKAELSLIQLTAFDLAMKLSDDFKLVIDFLPCCDETYPAIHDHIVELLIPFFGFTFVSDISLGGIAQQFIAMSRTNKENLVSQGVSISHEAKVSFDANVFGGEFGFGSTGAQKTTNHTKFKSVILSSDTSKFGGDVQSANFSEWSKTVLNDPIITKFTLRDISRLLTPFHFPSDPLIKNKSVLVEKILEKYLNGSVYCYGNCGSNNAQGTCEPTGYFQFGICKCNPGWSGTACETKIETRKILHGTLCGIDRSFFRVGCHGSYPYTRCPSGWASYNWHTDVTVCYKVKTELGQPVHGTLCGLKSHQSVVYPFSDEFGCNSSTVKSGSCPVGYQYFGGSGNGWTDTTRSAIRVNAVCVVINAQESLPGTLCGLQIEWSRDGPTCDGFNPGLSECPQGFSIKRTGFNDFGFLTCVKN